MREQRQQQGENKDRNKDVNKEWNEDIVREGVLLLGKKAAISITRGFPAANIRFDEKRKVKRLPYE